MIIGRVEVANQFQVRGWAFDRDNPETRVEVEIRYEDVPIATATADRYRADLCDAGIGDGEHSYVFNFPSPLPELAEDRIDVWACRGADAVKLQREIRADIVPNASSLGYRDETQWPVFVLGAARSGTSAMASGLASATRYRGFNEGHLLSLLGYVSNTVTAFYGKFSSLRDSMTAAVPQQVIEAKLDALFASIAGDTFSTPYWLDKTPSTLMIGLAPRLYRIWPNATFVFMKRRAIEYIQSRTRKFPAYPFAENCEVWADTMRAWVRVKDELGDAAIEVDQMDLARSPAAVANRLRPRLQLTATEVTRLTRSFKHDFPERTSANIERALSLGDLALSDESEALFESICGPMMDHFQYTRTSEYRYAAANAESVGGNDA